MTLGDGPKNQQIRVKASCRGCGTPNAPATHIQTSGQFIDPLRVEPSSIKFRETINCRRNPNTGLYNLF